MGAWNAGPTDADLQGHSKADSEVREFQTHFGSEMLGIDHGLNVGVAERGISRMNPRILGLDSG